MFILVCSKKRQRLQGVRLVHFKNPYSMFNFSVRTRNRLQWTVRLDISGGFDFMPRNTGENYIVCPCRIDAQSLLKLSERYLTATGSIVHACAVTFARFGFPCPIPATKSYTGDSNRLQADRKYNYMDSLISRFDFTIGPLVQESYLMKFVIWMWKEKVKVIWIMREKTNLPWLEMFKIFLFSDTSMREPVPKCKGFWGKVWTVNSPLNLEDRENGNSSIPGMSHSIFWI